MKFFTLLLVALALTAGVICLQHQPAAAVPSATEPTAAVPHGKLHRLHSPKPGRVWELYAQPGARVARGQVLAKLAVPFGSQERQQLQAALHRAEVAYAAARRQAPADAPMVLQAQLQLAAAHERLAQVPQRLAFEFVVAPAAGTVLALPVITGDYVSDSTAVLVLAEPLHTAEELAATP